MDLQIGFAPLELAPKQFDVGDTIRVTFSFKYVVAQDTTVTLRAGPYNYILGILNRANASLGSKEVILAKSAEPKEVDESIDFVLQGINAGSYGLIVEIPGTTYSTKADGVIVVAGAAGMGSIFSAIMPMLMMFMMLGMVMPMIQGMGGEEAE
jgi:hypothetical protein